MKVLVAPDKFKGSMSALAAAQAIARGWEAGWPGCGIVQAPIADGGEGFAEIFGAALGGESTTLCVSDPLGRPVEGRYIWVEAQKMAVLEMSEASGLWRLQSEERDACRATTFGTGELMRHAVERGARKILIGLGGSATTDGGVGMAQALGFRFKLEEDRELTPGNLAGLQKIEWPTSSHRELPEIVAACDVTNPLLGARGTARVFAPQKGATPEQVEQLEHALEALALRVREDLGVDPQNVPGAGAAGGIGFGLLAFCGATLRSGFELVAENLDLAGQIAACDLVITGEGRLDDQTLDGKGPCGVAQMAQQAGKPVLALAGSLGTEAEQSELFDAALPIVDTPQSLTQAMASGTSLLERAAFRAARLIALGAFRFAPGQSVIDQPTRPIAHLHT